MSITHEPAHQAYTSMVEAAAHVRGVDPDRTIAHLVGELEAIEVELVGTRDAPRRRLAKDGLACFNYLYRTVTLAVEQRQDFNDADFVERLAVVFAEFYLLVGRDGWRPTRAWNPLVSRRHERGITPLEFAIAGMNAHINNDLQWALVQVWDEFGVDPEQPSPQREDFRTVNQRLARVQPQVRAKLESGVLRWLDRKLRRLDDHIVGFSVAVARDLAWDRAVDMWRGSATGDGEHHAKQVEFESNLILGRRVDLSVLG
jgi:hypothetical protein